MKVRIIVALLTVLVVLVLSACSSTARHEQAPTARNAETLGFSPEQQFQAQWPELLEKIRGQPLAYTLLVEGDQANVWVNRGDLQWNIQFRPRQATLRVYRTKREAAMSQLPDQDVGPTSELVGEPYMGTPTECVNKMLTQEALR